MSLKTIVKINEVNNLTDARYVAGMGVDMIGFNIDKDDPQFVGKEKYFEIRSWISGVQIVGEINAFDKRQLEQVLEEFKPDVVQTTSIDTLKLLKDMKFPCIFKAFVFEYEKLEFLKLARNHPDFLLLEKPGEEITEMEDNQIRTLCREFNVLLSYGVTPENVNDLMKKYDLSGFGLFGGDEVRPGYRDFEDLADILENLEFE